MPSQPFAASFFMNARRSGVSTSCAKFSRVGSITAGSWFSASHFSTSSANVCSWGVRSKSIALGEPPDAGETGERAAVDQDVDAREVARARGDQERDQLRDLVWPSHPRERRV